MLKDSDQRGAVLIFSLLLLFLIFALGALIVDLLRIERASRSLQQTADSAALAGATQLGARCHESEGTLNQWNFAKRAAIAAIRTNQIFGDGEDTAAWQHPTLEGYEDPTVTPGEIYRYSDFDFPRLHVSIERVLYYRREDCLPGSECTPIELSLEGRTECEPAYPTPGLPAECCGNDFPYVRANAVRVTLTLKSLPLMFGRFVGLSDLSVLTRSALGSPDIAPPPFP
jgi:hypothetical protein